MAKRRRWSSAAKKSVRAYNVYKKNLAVRRDKLISRGMIIPEDIVELDYATFKNLAESQRQASQKRKISFESSYSIAKKQLQDTPTYNKYLKYKEALEERVDKMISKGLTPYNGLALSYKEYKELYQEERNDRLKEIESGERKSLGNINNELISDQVYEFSLNKAKSLYDYVLSLPEEERAGFDTSNYFEAIQRIREGQYLRNDLGLWDLVEDLRDDLKHLTDAQKTALVSKWKAKTFEEAMRKEVSATIFGS